jgi:sugar/nucleoside kinase (ribokinase family)
LIFICRNDIEGYIHLVGQFQPQLKHLNIVLKMGGAGVVVRTEGRTAHYPALPVDSIASVTGAGDSLVAGTIWAMFSHVLATPTLTYESANKDDNTHQSSLHASIQYGLAAAKLSLSSNEAVSPHLSPNAIFQMIHQQTNSRSPVGAN